ncbi:MAG: ATP-binding protein [Bacteroidetes bacterium]|nr:ATP-binding protein [Bacteroidota bacterium]MCY4205580.1 ATP-binding protein [Bacteroidota bacterium]
MDRASITHTLIVPSATRHLIKVRKFVVESARQAGVNETHIEALQLAVDEACANIIEHAYQGNSANKVNLTMTIEATRVIVRIRDHGRSFDRRAYQRPDVVELSRNRKSGGLGVDIIRRLMDHVEYFSEDGVNEITLIKLLRSDPSSSISSIE